MLPVNGPRHGQNCEDHKLYQQDYQEEHDVVVVGLLYRTELIFAYLRIFGQAKYKILNCLI